MQFYTDAVWLQVQRHGRPEIENDDVDDVQCGSPSMLIPIFPFHNEFINHILYIFQSHYHRPIIILNVQNYV